MTRPKGSALPDHWPGGGTALTLFTFIFNPGLKNSSELHSWRCPQSQRQEYGGRGADGRGAFSGNINKKKAPPQPGHAATYINWVITKNAQKSSDPCQTPGNSTLNSLSHCPYKATLWHSAQLICTCPAILSHTSSLLSLLEVTEWTRMKQPNEEFRSMGSLSMWFSRWRPLVL